MKIYQRCWCLIVIVFIYFSMCVFCYCILSWWYVKVSREEIEIDKRSGWHDQIEEDLAAAEFWVDCVQCEDMCQTRNWDCLSFHLSTFVCALKRDFYQLLIHAKCAITTTSVGEKVLRPGPRTLSIVERKTLAKLYVSSLFE